MAENWVLPNKKGFLKWAYSKYGTAAPVNSRLRPHQQLIRDYLNIYTPYRGLLLYHGLGTGKTAASIAVAESFLRIQRLDENLHKNRHIIVLVSASLEANYRKEIRAHATVDNPYRARWVKVRISTQPLYVFNKVLEDLYKIFYIWPEYARKQISRSEQGEFWLPGPLDPHFLKANPDVILDIEDAAEDAVARKWEELSPIEQEQAEILAKDLLGNEWASLEDPLKLHIESILKIIGGVPWADLHDQDKKQVDSTIDHIIKERFTFLHYNASNIVSTINKLNVNLNFDRTKMKWMRYKFPLRDVPQDFDFNLKSDYGIESLRALRGLNRKYNIEDAVYLFVPDIFIGVKHWSRYEEGLFDWDDIGNPYLAMDCFNKMIDLKPSLIDKIQIRRTIFDNSCIIMDEAHNFMSSITRESKTRVPIYRWMLNARNSKLVLLSGTPLINYPFELSMMINLLRGPMQHYRFKLREDTPVPVADEIALAFKERGILPMIDYISAKPNEGEIHYSILPYNFIRSDEGDLDIGFYIKQGKWPMNTQMLLREIEATLKTRFDSAGELIAETLFALPPLQENFNEMFLDQTDYTHPRVINGDFFQRRILGTVSFVRTAGMAKIVYNPPVRVQMSYSQYKNYIEVRITEIKMEESRYRKNRGSGAGPANPLAAQNTVYRAFSRMACNFTFMVDTDHADKNIQRKYPFNIRKELREEMASAADYEAGVEPSVTEEADEAEAQETAVEEASASAPGPSTMAAGGTFKRKIAGGNINKEVSKKYHKQLEELMKALKMRSNKMLSYDALRKITSPKFAAILEKIKEEGAPGGHRSGLWKTLLYSDFRTVEGIGILKLVLEEAGYVEVRFVKTPGGGQWTIENHEEVLSDKYNFKRFVEFTDDKDQAQMAVNFYNDNHKHLPSEIQAILKEAGLFADYKLETPYSDKEFWLRGGPCRIMMITKLASEGISLKNTRRVLITEPFWNNARINQVIGRAVRMDSHEHFKEEFASRGWEVDVDVFMFLSVFNPEHLNKDEKSAFTIKRIDANLTTDENIYQLAERKSEVIETFFGYLQSTAIDCMANAGTNKSEVPCYAFPVNSPANQLAYEPDIQRDKERAQLENKQIGERKIRGKATPVFEYITFKSNKRSRAQQQLSAIYYDRDAWTSRGELIPAALPTEHVIKYREPQEVVAALKEAIDKNEVSEVIIQRQYVRVKGYDEYFDYDAYVNAKVLTPAILNKVSRKWSIRTGQA